MGGARRVSEILAIAEGRAGYLAQSESKGKDSSRKTSKGFRDESSDTFRMMGFGYYKEDDKASTMKRRDYLDATDLVVHKE